MYIDTGETLSRPVYPQTNGFHLNHYIDEFSDNFSVGVSGSGASFGLNFQSGKVFDTYGNFSYYYKDKPINLDIYFSNSGYNYRINDIVLGAGNYNGYYWDSLYLRNYSTTTGFSAETYCYGQTPTMSYPSIYTEDQVNYSGYIVNNGQYKTVLFTGLQQDLGTGINFTLLPAYINPGETGYYQFSMSTGYYVSGNSVDLSFYYDWGYDEQTLDVIQIDTGIPTGFLSLYSAFEIRHNRTGIASVDYYWSAESDISVELEYTYGSGNTYLMQTGTGLASGNYSGVVNGSGYIYGRELVGYIYYQTGEYSGYIIATGSGALYTYATGVADYNYSILAVGLESGITATGYIYGTLYGNVGPGSGYYDFNEFVSGTPVLSVGGGYVFTSPTGIYTGTVTNHYILNAEVFASGTGMMTGSGYGLVREKTLLNTWNLKAGSYTNTMYNFKNSGWYNSGSYLRTFSGMPTEITEIDIEVDYTGYYGSYDLAVLRVSNGVLTKEIEISGYYS